MPPSPYPTFQDSAVPVARNSVGKRSFRKAIVGPEAA
jgi:hypothetical protein